MGHSTGERPGARGRELTDSLSSCYLGTFLCCCFFHGVINTVPFLPGGPYAPPSVIMPELILLRNSSQSTPEIQMVDPSDLSYTSHRFQEVGRIHIFTPYFTSNEIGDV